MTGYLNDFINGNPTEYVPKKKLLDMGVDAVAPFDIPAQDRNRTSPFRKHALPRFSPLFGFFQTVKLSDKLNEKHGAKVVKSGEKQRR